jgi:hypothetical protein
LKSWILWDSITEKAKNIFEVMAWSAELSESNYECDMKILTALYTNKNPEEDYHTDDAKKEVKKMGQMIYDRGVMTVMQYILSNFMDFCDGNNHMSHISSLEAMWSGIGEWEY